MLRDLKEVFPEFCFLISVLSLKSKDPTAIALCTINWARNLEFRKLFTVGIIDLASGNINMQMVVQSCFYVGYKGRMGLRAKLI